MKSLKYNVCVLHVPNGQCFAAVSRITERDSHTGPTRAARLYLYTLNVGAVLEVIAQNGKQLGQIQTAVRCGLLALAFKAVIFWENLEIIKRARKITCVFMLNGSDTLNGFLSTCVSGGIVTTQA